MNNKWTVLDVYTASENYDSDTEWNYRS